MNNLQEQKIKKLISFDFDDTLVHTLLPAEGKMIWKEKTGKDWEHRAWWSRPESLDMDVFDIPLNKKIYRRYKQAISDPDNYVILATGRVKPLQDEVYKILGHYGLSFDETHLNPGIDTFEFKSNLFAKLIYELQPEEFVMYDDRQEHLVKFVQWANAMPCKVTIIDAISGEEFKPKNLQESIRRILKEETNLISMIRRRVPPDDLEREFKESLDMSSNMLVNLSHNGGGIMHLERFIEVTTSILIDGIHHDIYSAMPFEYQWYDEVKESLSNHFKHRIGVRYKKLMSEI